MRIHRKVEQKVVNLFVEMAFGKHNVLRLNF